MTIFHSPLSRLTLALGGIIGAAGVITAAAASHGGDAHLLGSASTICLAHGPVLVALGLFGLRTRPLMFAALLLTLGTLVFAGDLILRHATGNALFPMSAPTGGVFMIGGWVALVIAAIAVKG
jgi:uncharacterized membrane protein YgdD (TMEM256/DUF423 family)